MPGKEPGTTQNQIANGKETLQTNICSDPKNELHYQEKIDRKTSSDSQLVDFNLCIQMNDLQGLFQ